MPMGKTKNIGDYIQILATRQFYNHIDGFIEKEDLSHFQSKGGDKVKAIVNGWFMWKPENWPPSEDIVPLFISIHFSPLIIKDILLKKDYLKQHSPIGCRDLTTLYELRRSGIESYFSGCITLTLGKSYHFEGRRKGICFVDPYFPIPSRKELSFINSIKLLLCFVNNVNKILYLSRNNFFKNYGKLWGYESVIPGIKGTIKSILKATCFYMTYHTYFSDRVIMSSDYILHIVPVSKDNPLSHDDWLKKADNYLQKYMKAELVVTSRIHAALPCLAMETPVIFMNSESLNSNKIEFNTPGRLEGIIDFFRTMTIKEFSISTCDEILKAYTKIDTNIVFKNKDNWREYAKRISEICIGFMK